MKKILICCFLFLQIISCSFGTIEVIPEATKFSMQNKSKVQLFNVRWNNTNFGNIGLGELSVRDVSEGNDYVYFETRKGTQYRTAIPFDGKKHIHNKLTFIDNTPVYGVGTLGDVLNVD
jgi:hypothetical protein